MAGRQRLTPQIQGLAIQGLGLGVAVGVFEHAGEVVQARGDVGVVGRQRHAPESQGLAI